MQHLGKAFSETLCSLKSTLWICFQVKPSSPALTHLTPNVPETIYSRGQLPASILFIFFLSHRRGQTGCNLHVPSAPFPAGGHAGTRGSEERKRSCARGRAVLGDPVAARILAREPAATASSPGAAPPSRTPPRTPRRAPTRRLPPVARRRSWRGGRGGRRLKSSSRSSGGEQSSGMIDIDFLLQTALTEKTHNKKTTNQQNEVLAPEKLKSNLMVLLGWMMMPKCTVHIRAV
ncbi:uncharacterized protein LOC110401284 [Numida meleagris]|uniref:uncharacterized protein LOC110401284 n=1 Tax=Numida meleagris TaxID=8996 RepID=UPI000B3DE319|nr:uncharacterized protein LOC110401284 [Numida meleagris]